VQQESFSNFLSFLLSSAAKSQFPFPLIPLEIICIKQPMMNQFISHTGEMKNLTFIGRARAAAASWKEGEEERKRVDSCDYKHFLYIHYSGASSNGQFVDDWVKLV
jgi:hypothetical protein